ncbi:MAG TPA: diguanylate cyclase [Candidatus Angelobacter sp.]|nr:diguanylate cyclase [Candidatus Angelobacter sp.]
MAKSTAQLTVLVVDDSAIYRKLVEHALEEAAYTPIFAKNGREALELYAKHAPSIVITDWMMPDFSGLELCEHIRGDALNPYTYIIVLTSISEKDNVVKGLAAGADDYLTKPFDPGELLARIGVGRRTIDLHREIDAKNKLLEEMAHTDPLTGLANRRAIEEWAQRQLRGAARHGYSLWVVHADLDCFKSVNDNHGHDAGDEVLKRFAKVLKENTRASDICGRMGGDEFLLVITHVQDAHIRTTVDRLREQFCSQKFSFGGKTFSVTVSIGVCGFQGSEPPEFSRLVRQADKALYGAKHAGRNQAKLESL